MEFDRLEFDTKSLAGREKIIEGIVKKNELSEESSNNLKPTDGHALRLSDLPKINKDGVPLPGVVSTVGSPYEKIPRYLIPILRTIQGWSGLLVKKEL